MEIFGVRRDYIHCPIQQSAQYRQALESRGVSQHTQRKTPSAFLAIA